jgi:hypothetical protein
MQSPHFCADCKLDARNAGNLKKHLESRGCKGYAKRERENRPPTAFVDFFRRPAPAAAAAQAGAGAADDAGLMSVLEVDEGADSEGADVPAAAAAAGAADAAALDAAPLSLPSSSSAAAAAVPKCPGMLLGGIFGKPFAFHVQFGAAAFPRNVNINMSTGEIRSNECSGDAIVAEIGDLRVVTNTPCEQCRAIERPLAKLALRAHDDASSSTMKNSELSLHQLTEKNRVARGSLRALQLESMNKTVTIERLQRRLFLYDDLLHSVASSDYSRVNIIFRLELARGASVSHMRARLEMAITRCWKPRSTPAEKDVVAAVALLGGPAAAEALARATGCVLPRAALVAASMGRTWEITWSEDVVHLCLENNIALAEKVLVSDADRQIAIDAVSMTPGVGYASNFHGSATVTGTVLLREPLPVRSLEDVDEFARAVENKELRLATSMNVASMQPLGGHRGVALPIHAHGVCGNTTADVFRFLRILLISLFVFACADGLGRIAFLGFDGDGGYRGAMEQLLNAGWSIAVLCADSTTLPAALFARVSLALITKLDKHAERLHAALVPMAGLGFDVRLGPGGVVPAPDLRHIIKTLRVLWLTSGVLIDVININPKLLIMAVGAGLNLEPGCAALAAICLLTDKMNVCAAVLLLQGLERFYLDDVSGGGASTTEQRAGALSGLSGSHR